MLAGAAVILPPEAEVSLNTLLLPGFNVAGFPAFVQDFIFGIPFIHELRSTSEGKARNGEPKDDEQSKKAEYV
jgi:hypothetical protein